MCCMMTFCHIWSVIETAMKCGLTSYNILKYETFKGRNGEKSDGL